jgi:hypothetical protein
MNADCLSVGRYHRYRRAARRTRTAQHYRSGACRHAGGHRSPCRPPRRPSIRAAHLVVARSGTFAWTSEVILQSKYPRASCSSLGSQTLAACVRIVSCACFCRATCDRAKKATEPVGEWRALPSVAGVASCHGAPMGGWRRRSWEWPRSGYAPATRTGARSCATSHVVSVLLPHCSACVS